MTAIPVGLPVFDSTHWTRDALCAQTDAEAFYPEKGGTATAAARVCESCPVTRECLEATLAFEEISERSFGYAGGMSANSRRRLLISRRAA